MNTDIFTPHGYYTISNNSGYLVEHSPCGEMARLQDHNGITYDWVVITQERNYDWDGETEEEEFILAIPDGDGYIPLNMVMKL